MIEPIEVIFPDYSDGSLSKMLRALTRAISEKTDARKAGGLLGGEYGYGCDYENDVFYMFPYYWGDCTCGYEQKEIDWAESNDHKKDCYHYLVTDELLRRGFKKEKQSFCGYRAQPPESLDYKIGLSIEDEVRETYCKKLGLTYPFGCVVHCTCGLDKRWAEFLENNSHSKDCPIIRHNFYYKPTGFWVDWYKYIGRSMESSGEIDIGHVFNKCIESLVDE